MTEDKKLSIELRKRKILLLIRDTDFAGKIARLLMANGYNVKAAANNADLNSLVGDWNPQVILADTWALDRQLHDIVWKKSSNKGDSKIPVLFLTQADTLIEISSEVASMIDDYVNLPASDQEIILRVRRLLR